MSLSLIYQQCSAYLACLIWVVCEVGGKWTYSCCFVGCCFQNLLKRREAPLFSFQQAFSPVISLKSKGCNHTAWKNSHFYFIRLNFDIIINLSLAFHASSIYTLTLLSADKILLLRYVNWLANFKGLPFYVLIKMVPSL